MIINHHMILFRLHIFNYFSIIKIIAKAITIICLISSLLIYTSCTKHSEIQIIAENPRRLSAGDDFKAASNSVVYFNGYTYSISSKPFTIIWEQISGIPVIINNPYDLYANFLTPQVFSRHDLTFRVSSTDETSPLISDDVIVTIFPVVDLSTAQFSFNRSPKPYQKLTIQIENSDHFGFLTWEITKKPGNALLDIQLSQDRKSITLEPNLQGQYEITVSSSASETIRRLSFIVASELPFDPSKIRSNERSQPIEKIMGEITNQSWIYSNSLTKDALNLLISQESSLHIIGYDGSFGTLVEYDDQDPYSAEALERLKQKHAITTVNHRFYEGKSAIRNESVVYTTNDYGDWDQVPQGDNWHLEKISAPKAWPISTGSANILIGVSDAGFSTDHEDLLGRVMSNLASSTNELDHTDHGNAVSGTIAAIANNGIGISGINWQSQVITAGTGIKSIEALAQYQNIKVITSSWGIPEQIPIDFNPNNTNKAKKRQAAAKSATRAYRQLASRHPDKLFIWSAGNGVGNGKGNEGIYGIEGKYHSPILHMANNNQIAKLGNVIFVGALANTNRLKYYSSYGNLVDIAAPSHFKSLTTHDYSTFVGTSAAAPVVAGIASLLFSMNPQLTGKEVKDILVNSASQQASQRHTEPTEKTIQQLHYPIPIIDAYEALKYLKDILDNKIHITASFPDPFVNQIRITYSPFSEKDKINSIQVDLEYNNNGSWQALSKHYANSNTIAITPTINSERFRVNAFITLNTALNDTKSINLEHVIEPMTLILTVQDSIKNTPLNQVEILVENLSNHINYTSGFTNLEGQSQLFLESGHYKISAKKLGFQSSSQEINITHTSPLSLRINLFQLNDNQSGAIDGIITNSDGLPLVGSTIRLSGGKQTDGFFISTITDNQGFYLFPNIPTTDTKGSIINQFILEISHKGYHSSTNNISIIPRLRKTKNIQLTRSFALEDNYFYDDVEIDRFWHSTGLWHRINLSDKKVQNLAVNRGYTSLTSDNTNDLATLPNATSGDYAWWYGSILQGNYIGDQDQQDISESGGTSTQAHSGELISPAINLISAKNPLLQFKTWWEIEAMNPNRQLFDTMDILITTDAGQTFTHLLTLNPLYDPIEYTRKNKPLTSSGFNREPIWNQKTVNLSAYEGEVIQIAFRFNTHDNLHNGFRGWLIDDIEIIGMATNPDKE